jgi:catechol 2,3-dioxygenase-like lactoylglutathione lyase family enzyme
MIIHHISLGTNDIERARGFYDAVFGVLGLRLLEASERAIDYGTGAIFVTINLPLDGKPATAGNGSHIAFSAENRAMVDDFYRVALNHGGSSDGEPGVRPEYDPHYYGAFVLDPDGNKIEAVTYSAK